MAIATDKTFVSIAMLATVAFIYEKRSEIPRLTRFYIAGESASQTICLIWTALPLPRRGIPGFTFAKMTPSMQ
jgi:hypothetical protein